MITLKLQYRTNNQNFFNLLRNLRREQSAVYRSVYQLAAAGLKEKEIRKKITNQFKKSNLDSWFFQSAIKAGIAAAKADHRLEIKKRIFGGKKNFYRRSKKLITNQDWKEKRLEKLYLIGEAPNKGNRKFAFRDSSVIFKLKKGIKFELKFPKLRKNYQKYYDFIQKETVQKNLAVTVSLDEKYLYLSFDDTRIQEERKVIKNRYLGIDLNPNYIGVSFFKEDKALLDTKLYNLKSLTGKHYNSNKLKHELREIAHQIGRIANYYQINYFFVEDLKFDQGNKLKGKNFNRLTQNQFLIREFKRVLDKYCKVIKLNAKYSSTVGNILNFQYPDPIAASIEIARRGIENRIVAGGGNFFPKLVSKKDLQNQWKEAEDWTFQTWVELHNLLKKTGVKYRVPIPKIGMFRKFKSSLKSKILLI